MSDDKFSELGLSEKLIKALQDSGYENLTPVQQQTIPQALMGRDVLAIAQTGSGKTAAFTLPVLEQLQGRVSRVRMPRCLILEPTRELALQVQDYFEKFLAAVPLNVSLLIGGVSLNNDERNALNNCDVLIATPGRLLDHLERGTIMLADIKHFIIDEADRMLDMGFIPDIRKIASQLPRIRQTLLFSATMPKDIRALADDFMINPKEISVARSGTTATTISQYVVKCRDKKQKYEALVRLLEDISPIGDADANSGIIFCNKKRDVKILADGLQRREFNAEALHGDMHQHLRMECLQKFKDGDINLLVCSDVAARGLDIAAVDFVINFDLPDFSEDYVHRIGRTGRAGRKGSAYSLVERLEQKNLQNVESLTRQKLSPYRFGGGGDGKSDTDNNDTNRPRQYALKCRDRKQKYNALKRLLNEVGDGKGIIFYDKNDDGKILIQGLQRRELKAEIIYGDTEEDARAEILQKFKDGEFNFLVHVAEAFQESDIGTAADFIINFNLPKAGEDYPKRMTCVGDAGVVYNLVEWEERQILQNVESQIGAKLPPYVFSESSPSDSPVDDDKPSPPSRGRPKSKAKSKATKTKATKSKSKKAKVAKPKQHAENAEGVDEKSFQDSASMPSFLKKDIKL